MAFDEGAPILLSMHESPLGPGVVAMRGEPVVKELRRVTGFLDINADFLLLGRWASFYDFTILEKHVSDARWLLEAAGRYLKESRMSEQMLHNLLNFIEDARATDSAIEEMDRADRRIEYVADDLHRTQMVDDGAAYREKFKTQVLVHMKSRASALITALKEIALSQPTEFKRALAAIHNLVPMKTLRRLSVNNEFDFS